MKVWGGKAFAAEQKIREFKKILLRSKRFEKSAQNMSETILTKQFKKGV